MDSVSELCSRGDLTGLKRLYDFGDKTDFSLADYKGETILFDAIRSCSDDVIRFLVSLPEVKVNIQTKDDGKTPLHVASVRGRPRIVVLLVEKGANVNATDREGYTPLHLACQNGYIRCCRRLIQLGANILAKTRGGVTPVWSACFSKSPEVLLYLLDHGAKLDHAMFHMVGQAKFKPNKVIARIENVNEQSDRGETYFLVGCRTGNQTLVEALLKRGANPKIPDKKGNTALHYLFLVETLLDLGVDANARNIMGIRPIHNAAMDGREDLVRLLVSRGADVDVRDEVDEYTPLHHACKRNKLEMVLLLLEKGGNPNAKSRTGKTPLHLCKSREVAEALLDHEANLHERDDEGHSPLYDACEDGRAEVVELLAKRVDVNSGNPLLAACRALSKNRHEEREMCIRHLVNNGAEVSTGGPLSYCYWRTDLAMFLLSKGARPSTEDLCRVCGEFYPVPHLVEEMLRRGADPNGVNDQGETPLHIAASRSLECTKLLIAGGANVNSLDRSGNPPLYYACEKRKSKTIRFLVLHHATPIVHPMLDMAIKQLESANTISQSGGLPDEITQQVYTLL